jgi:hypothetical protein
MVARSPVPGATIVRIVKEGIQAGEEDPARTPGPLHWR